MSYSSSTQMTLVLLQNTLLRSQKRLKAELPLVIEKREERNKIAECNMYPGIHERNQCIPPVLTQQLSLHSMEAIKTLRAPTTPNAFSFSTSHGSSTSTVSLWVMLRVIFCTCLLIYMVSRYLIVSLRLPAQAVGSCSGAM